MKKIIYELYICIVCKHEKPHLSVLESSTEKSTWCNECQAKTIGRWINAVEK